MLLDMGTSNILQVFHYIGGWSPNTHVNSGFLHAPYIGQLDIYKSQWQTSQKREQQTWSDWGRKRKFLLDDIS